MEYSFATDETSRQFFNEIAERMVLLFGIKSDEAVGRMNRLWSGQTFLGPDTLIDHETPDHWANHVFFGGASWWNTPPGLEPLPYP